MPSPALFEDTFIRRIESLTHRFNDDERPRALALVVGFLLVGAGSLGDLLISAGGDYWLRSLLTGSVVLAAWGASLLCFTTGRILTPLFILGTTISVNFAGQFFLTGEKYFLVYSVSVPIGMLLLGGPRVGVLWLWIVIAKVWTITLLYEAYMGRDLAFWGHGNLRECVPISVAAAAMLGIGLFTESVKVRLERRRAEATESLESERLRLQTLMNSSYQGMLECNRDGIVLMASAGTQEVIGWHHDELRQRPLLDIVHVSTLR